MRSFLFPPHGSTRLSIGLLLLRVLAGVGLMHHGWRKIQNPFGWMGENAWAPPILQALAALSEFGGGLALAIGLLVPLAALGVGCTMLTAAGQHISKGDPFVGRGGSWELASVYLMIAILFVLVGPGRFSLDALLARRFRVGS